MKLVALLVAALALVSCNRGVESKAAVRQAVIDYLAARTNLNMGSMNVDVTAVSFKGDQADATVAFSPKGANAGAAQGMSMRYTLERKGNRWVVKGRADSGSHGGMGGMGASPHGGAAGQMPAMPPNHPPMPGGEKKQ